MDKSIPFEEQWLRKFCSPGAAAKILGSRFVPECRFKTHSINMPDRPARQKSESWRVSGPNA